jgi:type IV pilus assembly protein PilB
LESENAGDRNPEIVRNSSMSKASMIGDLLIRAALIDSSGLDRALEVQSKKGGSLGKILADLGLTDENAVSEVISRELRLDRVGPSLPEVLPEIVGLLPAEFCRKRLVVPLSLKGKSLRLAMADPLDYATVQDVKFRTSKEVVAVSASESVILALLGQSEADPSQSRATYEMLTNVIPEGEIVADAEAAEFIDAAKLAKDITLAPVVRLVNLILSGAAKEGASDIHIEPKEKYLQVRQRVDGLLQDVFKVPKHLQNATISRLKIISGMDIADHRRSQDGRSQLRFEGKRIDLRVSSLPTQFGEKVVVRLLDQRRAQMTMNQLDLTPDNLRVLQALLLRPQGMILVTGPTGSGKSSTLYTSLNWVKSATNNIITIEDPIEYQLDGVNQVQINAKAGVTFAGGLRSILRQDPNIIFVGEIRDQETAGIALEAAQTGHLLLSTLHTNDAPGTISRLFDLGIEPFLVASSLIGILAQRLVRRTCSSCAVPQAPAADVVEKIGGSHQLPLNGQWRVGRGCEKCAQSGFKGRIAVHELLQVNDELRELITRRAPEHEIRRAARAGGMRTLVEDGIAKAAQGFTTLEAILKVVAPDDMSVADDEAGNRAVPGGVSLQKDTAQQSHPVAPESPGTIALKEKSLVLIVEDDRTITTVVKYFLEMEGFEVLVAGDGLIGLETAKREQPRVIVTDLDMPGMDGLAMVKALRGDALTQDVSILMLTSRASVESETLALSLGADDYILKPVEPRRLAARVKALLARSKTRALVGSK